MKSIYGLAFSLVLAGAACAQDEHPTTEQMAQVLVEIAASQSLPAQLDQTTKMVAVRASGLSLTYFYELNEQATSDQVRSFFARNRLPGLCADEDVLYSFQRGVTFRYSYTTLSETNPIVIVVGLADCEGL